MKYTEAWSDVASKNVMLKYVVLILALCCIGFAITSTRLALRDPLIVERGCVTRTASLGSADRSAAEIESFIKEAISRRFDSDAPPSDGYLSLEEDAGRKKDQQTLTSQGMRQRVLVNSVKVDGNNLSLDCDRLISISGVRSAFSYPLTAVVGTVARSESNPYGLVLVKVAGPNDGKKEKK